MGIALSRRGICQRNDMHRTPTQQHTSQQQVAASLGLSNFKDQSYIGIFGSPIFGNYHLFLLNQQVMGTGAISE